MPAQARRWPSSTCRAAQRCRPVLTFQLTRPHLLLYPQLVWDLWLLLVVHNMKCHAAWDLANESGLRPLLRALRSS